MKIKIEKRYSNETRLEGEAESFKQFIEENKSDLRGSNLRGSDLSDSDLSDSNLSGSDLRWAKIKASQKDELLRALRIEVVGD